MGLDMYLSKRTYVQNWDDLRDTVTMLRPYLGDQDSDYYYRSSW
jgi:hypothetical protein